jgi:glycosyltransferase involved in cell wall biosynthesis/GT2 family glycosyltransferase
VRLLPRPGEDVVGVRTWGRHPALFLYDPRPLWRALGDSWDVLDIHEEPFALSTAEILLVRALRRQRAPYVVYSAQNLPKRYPPPFRWFERAVLRHASGASVCNSDAGRILERKGLPVPGRVIPLGTDLDVFTPGTLPGRLDREADVVRVGYAGRLGSHKGVDVLVDAVALDPRLSLSLAGAGPLDAALRRRCAELGISDRVEFLGSLPTDRLPDFYRSVDVVAVPSLATPGWVEQFGRVAVEAMACGTPVVGTATGALPDVLGEAGVLVSPGDSRALAGALLSVATDTGTRERLVRAGLERARETGWDEVAQAYEELYAAAGATGDRTGPARTPRARQVLGDAPLKARPLHVLVVAYGRADLLREALEPLVGERVTVIDNSSSPEVRVVCSDLGVAYVDPERNGGFAAGVNEGLRHVAPGADVLLLNPDAVISREDVHRLHAALVRDPSAASAGPAQVDGRGEQTRVAWPFPTPAGVWVEAIGLGRLRTAPGFVIGSVLVLRAEALAEVGGLDERFFLYAEETDWAYRASSRGWRHVLVPDVTAHHLGAALSTNALRREIHFHASQEHYFRKHYGSVGWAVARGGQVLGSAARSLLPGERGRSARQRVGLFVSGPARREHPLLEPHLSTAGGGGS